MLYELFIGLRYLKSKRKQTFISIITFISIGGVAVGVMALIVVLSVMSGFEEDLRDKILGTNPHIVIQKWGNLNLDDYKNIITGIKNIRGVKSASPFIYNQVMVSTEGGVSGLVVRGIDPADEAGVTDIKQYIKEGSLADLENAEKKYPPPFKTSPLPDEESPEGIASSPPISEGDKDMEKPLLAGIILGKELYHNMNAYPGMEITIISPQGKMSPMGMVPRMKKFRVVGNFASGMFEYDSGLAFISLNAAQKFFNMENTVNGIGVKIEDIYLARRIAHEVENNLGPTYISRTWMQMNKNLFSALRLEKIVMFIILTLIILVAAFNIVSTLIMVVMEKGKDIAILKSMGASNRSIMGIFSLEGLIIGLLGTLIGLIGGLSIVSSLDQIIAILEKVFGINIFPSDVYYLDKLPVKINYFDISLTVFAAIAISLLAAIYPARRAVKIDPVEAIRYE